MTETEHKLKEGYHEHGQVRCGGCNETVDLSDADDIHEAADIWNKHLREEHRDSADDGGQ